MHADKRRLKKDYITGYFIIFKLLRIRELPIIPKYVYIGVYRRLIMKLVCEYLF